MLQRLKRAGENVDSMAATANQAYGYLRAAATPERMEELDETIREIRHAAIRHQAMAGKIEWAVEYVFYLTAAVAFGWLAGTAVRELWLKR